MAEVPLTRGKVALIDATDVELVGPFRWHAALDHGNWYARRATRVGGQQVLIQMHNFVTGWPQTDHINGDGLDNRRCNLRAATNHQNARNRRKNRGGSRFKGIYPKDGHWVAHIRIDGRLRYLGFYREDFEAARAYDAAARHHFGEYAALNFPLPGERSALDSDWRVT